MLHDVYLDAIKKREDRMAALSDTDSKNKKILDRARELWVGYSPRTKKSVLGGVDSSYNRQQFQGFHLYVVDAVCVGSDGKILSKDFADGIERIGQSWLEARSMELETDVAQKAADDIDLVLIDGAMTSRFVGASPDSHALKSLAGLIGRHSNVVFVAKSSDSTEILGKMNGRMGDIYYFGRVSREAGYSKPHRVRVHAEPVTFIYARLSDYTPVVKLEIPGEVGEDEVKNILDRITYGSVSGYPYVLKLAHKTALVSDDDIERLAGIYGLKNEIGAREVLR